MQRPSSTGPSLRTTSRPRAVVEEAPVPVDPREPRSQEQLSPSTSSQRTRPRALREEAVATEVEAVAVPDDRLRQAADLLLGLEDEHAPAELGEQVAGGEPGRAGAQDQGGLPVPSHGSPRSSQRTRRTLVREVSASGTAPSTRRKRASAPRAEPTRRSEWRRGASRSARQRSPSPTSGATRRMRAPGGSSSRSGASARSGAVVSSRRCVAPVHDRRVGHRPERRRVAEAVREVVRENGHLLGLGRDDQVARLEARGDGFRRTGDVALLGRPHVECPGAGDRGRGDEGRAGRCGRRRRRRAGAAARRGRPGSGWPSRARRARPPSRRPA